MRIRTPKTHAPVVIKKYGNRRLYDMGLSRYITLEELEEKVRGGAEVRVLDAKTNDDLTQQTLAQIILESRGAARLLPVPLLAQLIRMKDEALAEFFGRYVSGALELYLQARQGAEAVAPYVPMATVPFTATNAIARMFLGATQMLSRDPKGETPVPPAPYPYPPAEAFTGPPAPPATEEVVETTEESERATRASSRPSSSPESSSPESSRPVLKASVEDDVAVLRRELEQLKAQLDDVARARTEEPELKRAKRR